MDFGLSEEQELLQRTVATFIENECPPTRVREIFDASDGHDATLWKGLAELGVAGLIVAETYGGAGLELVDLALVAETLGAGAVPGPFLGNSLASLALTLGGSDAQKERWLPRLAAGEALATIALGEADAGWTPESWTTRFEGEGAELTLSGTKVWVPSAAAADLIVVGGTGGALALVEAGASGLAVSPIDGVDRSRRVDAITLDGVAGERLTNDARVAQRVYDAALVLLAADAFGGASRLVEMAVDYAKTREQFGVTIAHFQAVKHQLANMAVEIEPARGLFWYAAYAWDVEEPDSSRAASIAKAHISDRFMQVARDTVEIHGGIGFTWECDVQIWFKRAMFDRTFLGAPAFHRERASRLAGW